MGSETAPERRIYWAYHCYDDDERNLKTIGFFSEEIRAKSAIDALKSKPGFRDHPNGFSVDSCKVDAAEWQDGFGIDDA
jgi:hypothetical protein